MNPYSPPESSAAELVDTHVHTPRPIAVWIFLLFMLVYTVIAAAGTVTMLWALATQPSLMTDFLTTVFSVAWRIALLAAMIATLYSVWQRRRWTRWVVLLIPVALAAYSILASDHSHYTSDAERAGGYFARFLFLPLLFVWWAYALAFSNKAKRYFSSPRNGA